MEEFFEDPITMEIMVDASILPCGHSFSHSTLEEWLQSHDSCPSCKFVPVSIADVRPNYQLRHAIEAFQQKQQDKGKEEAQKRDKKDDRDGEEKNEERGGGAAAISRLSLSSSGGTTGIEGFKFQEMHPDDMDDAIEVLSLAMLDDDWFQYMFPPYSWDYKSRMEAHRWMFSLILSYAIKHGRVFVCKEIGNNNNNNNSNSNSNNNGDGSGDDTSILTTDSDFQIIINNKKTNKTNSSSNPSSSKPNQVVAVAVWQPPFEQGVSVWRMIKCGAAAAPFKLGITGSLRMTHVMDASERNHARLMGHRKHWTLYCIGVMPKRQGRGIGTELVQPMLRQSEEAKLPVYVDVAAPRAMTFFRRLGFVERERVGTGLFSKAPSFVMMTRECA